MQFNRTHRSPNFDPAPIPVEFVVLHYTAGSLESTLALFLDPAREVSAHLVVDEDGAVYELVPCWDGVALRAWHAGRSDWDDGEISWDGFNNFSIGIEIVNLNGNFFPYSEAQYAALKDVIDHLRDPYPALNAPERVLGHEHIAGWRGKVDPGIHFDWGLFYGENYPYQTHPRRVNVCHPEILAALVYCTDAISDKITNNPAYWHGVSQLMETCHRLLNSGGERHGP